MSIKVLLLKSNDYVIADVKELSVEEKTVGYLLSKPFIMSLKYAEVLFNEVTSNGNNVAVKFDQYIPFTDQKEIPIPCDWVVTIVDPVRQIRETYEETINANSKNSSIDEQSDTDNSD
jgi:hypothetical protein